MTRLQGLTREEAYDLGRSDGKNYTLTEMFRALRDRRLTAGVVAGPITAAEYLAKHFHEEKLYGEILGEERRS